MTRNLLFCLACLPAISMAQTTPDSFNQEKFEERFRAADKDGDGRLSREEAYAEFPRAPELFREIDTNNDNYITLTEVNQARTRRIESALNAGAIGTGVLGGAKYLKPDYLKSDQTQASGVSDPTDLSSAIAHKRSNEFDELLGDDQSTARNPDTPVPPNPPIKFIDKSFKPL